MARHYNRLFLIVSTIALILMYMSEYNALCIDRNHALSQDDYGASDCHLILVLLDY